MPGFLTPMDREWTSMTVVLLATSLLRQSGKFSSVLLWSRSIFPELFFSFLWNAVVNHWPFRRPEHKRGVSVTFLIWFVKIKIDPVLSFTCIWRLFLAHCLLLLTDQGWWTDPTHGRREHWADQRRESRFGIIERWTLRNLSFNCR